VCLADGDLWRDRLDLLGKGYEPFPGPGATGSRQRGFGIARDFRRHFSPFVLRTGRRDSDPDNLELYQPKSDCGLTYARIWPNSRQRYNSRANASSSNNHAHAAALYKSWGEFETKVSARVASFGRRNLRLARGSIQCLQQITRLCIWSTIHANEASIESSGRDLASELTGHPVTATCHPLFTRDFVSNCPSGLAEHALPYECFHAWMSSTNGCHRCSSHHGFALCWGALDMAFFDFPSSASQPTHCEALAQATVSKVGYISCRLSIGMITALSHSRLTSMNLRRLQFDTAPVCEDFLTALTSVFRPWTY
jgi:hypothetical protein